MNRDAQPALQANSNPDTQPSRLWRSGPASLAIGAVRAYQVVLGPLLGGRCRFHPTCSEYAVQALKERGLLVGLGLTLRRLARCHPLGGHGVDPVPAPKHYP